MTDTEAKDAESLAENPDFLRLEYSSAQAIIFITSSSDFP